MTKQFAKGFMIAAATAAVFAFSAPSPVHAADQSEDWLEQQLSITDGVASPWRDTHPAAVPQRNPESARNRPAAAPANSDQQAGGVQHSFLIQQLEETEGAVQ
jgi:hypothetical protein